MAAFRFLGLLPIALLGCSRVLIGAVGSSSNAGAVTLVYDNWIISTADIGCP